jgi:aldehyde dehydrogenase (NAD+)/betaine-aldehyde dehydrogenase
MTLSTTTEPGRFRGETLAASCFIDGRWVDGDAGSGTDVLDPATEETLAHAHFASVAQVSAAVAAARRASDDGAWSAVSPRDRSTLLHRLTDLFEAHADELTALMTAETGSPTALSRGLQVQGALETLRWFADAAAVGPGGAYERGLPFGRGPIPSASMLRWEPAGVVAAITAYNYPMLLLSRKIGPALAAGCTAVVMPSERAPLSTVRFFELLEEVGYPPGVANLVIGGKDVGQALTTHPQVDLVSFTGSVAVGRQVLRQAADTTKKVVLELGGKSPTILLPGGDLDAFVGPSILRFTVQAGQGCGCTTRTLVAREDYDGYVEQATDFIAHLGVGDPRREGVHVGPLIRAEQRASVEGYVERAVDGGGEILAGGGRPDEPRGFFMNPALIAAVDNRAEIAQSELFGPVGVVLPYDTVDEAVALANDSAYGLNAGVFGPPTLALEVAQRLRSGTVAINGGGTPRFDIPWGGYGDSGIGRESGDEGFREYFEVKHIQWPVA